MASAVRLPQECPLCDASLGRRGVPGGVDGYGWTKPKSSAGGSGLSAGRSARRISSNTKGKDMTDSETPERTTGGLVGKVAGKAKELAGEATDNNELAREGRLQQGQVDAAQNALRERQEAEQAEQEAQLEREKAETRREREELEAEVEQRRRDEAAERDRERAEGRAQAQASEEIRDAKAAQRNEEAIAQQREERVETDAERKDEQAAKLEQQARRDEARAAALEAEEAR
jgi:uncharacterized protein YjbJ (UPF0337 family)